MPGHRQPTLWPLAGAQQQGSGWSPPAVGGRVPVAHPAGGVPRPGGGGGVACRDGQREDGPAGLPLLRQRLERVPRQRHRPRRHHAQGQGLRAGDGLDAGRRRGGPSAGAGGRGFPAALLLPRLHGAAGCCHLPGRHRHRQPRLVTRTARVWRALALCPPM